MNRTEEHVAFGIGICKIPEEIIENQRQKVDF